MGYNVNVDVDKCIGCGECVDVCPVDCFLEGPNTLVIDPMQCIDCAVCVPECPVSAIYADIDLPADLSNEMAKCNTDLEVEEVGTAWLLQQSKELKKAGVPVLHYYTLGRPHIVANVVKEL